MELTNQEIYLYSFYQKPEDSVCFVQRCLQLEQGPFFLEAYGHLAG
jgi:hypothetical protein